MQIPKIVNCAGYWIFRINDNNIETLIVETPNGYLSPPKGKMEKNETIKDCANRELYEETNLKLNQLNILDGGTIILSKNNIPSIYCYIAEIIDKNHNIKMHDKEEISSILWISIDDLLKHDKFLQQRKKSLLKAVDIYLKWKLEKKESL